MDSTNSSKSTNPVSTLISDASHAPSSSIASATMSLQKLTAQEMEMCHSIVNATPPLHPIDTLSEIQVPLSTHKCHVPACHKRIGARLQSRANEDHNSTQIPIEEPDSDFSKPPSVT